MMSVGFNELTRVQMPAVVHLTRLGYTYFGKIDESMAGTIYDPDTNILIQVFKEQFAKLNPEHAGEAEQVIRDIRLELDNDDLGHSFFKRLLAVSPVKLIDFDNIENNILSKKIQDYLNITGIGNNRKEKTIRDKYLTDNIKHTGCIVEVGFLSNHIEENNLLDDMHQNNVAYCIYLGILSYLEQ